MAITFLNTPKEIDFTGNPVSVKIHGTGFIKSPGSKALLTLQILGLGPQENDTISFNAINESFNLTFAGVPDDSGTQIQANVEWTIPQYLEKLAVSLESVPGIDHYYKITFSAAAGLIFLEAIEVGEYFSFTDISITSDGIAVHQSIPGSNFVVEETYCFSSSINEIECNNYERIVSLLQHPDLEGNAIINVGEKVQWKSWTAPIPDLSQNTSQLSTLAKRFVCKCAEIISGTEHRIYTSPEIVMLPGKVVFHLWPNYSLEDEIIRDKKYYTVKAHKQNTWKGANEFLNFLVPVDGHDIGIVVSVIYTDGTSLSKLTEVQKSVAKYELLTIPTGISQLQLQTWNPEKEIYSYEVRIYSQSETQNLLLAKPFEYQVIPVKPWYRQLIFSNHFGVWENLNITGKAKRIVSPTREISKKVHLFDYNPLTHQKRSVLTDTEDYIEVNTGAMLNVSADTLKHLVETSQLFLISDNGYIPVTLHDGSFEIQNESEDLINIKLQLEGIDGSDGLISHFGPGNYSEDYSNSYD